MPTPHDADSEGGTITAGEAGSTVPLVTLWDFVSSAQLKQRLPPCVQSQTPCSAKRGNPPRDPMMGAVKRPTLPLISNL